MMEVAAQGRDGKRHTLVVGDRLDTDMECAVRAGMDGLLVLTGVTSPSDLLRASPHQRPTHVGAGLLALSGPDEASRIPPWRAAAEPVAEAGCWRVGHAEDRLTLRRIDEGSGDEGGGSGDAVAALRALAAGAWAHPEWSTIAAADDASADVLARLGLTQFVGWSVPRTSQDARAASGA